MKYKKNRGLVNKWDAYNSGWIFHTHHINDNIIRWQVNSNQNTVDGNLTLTNWNHIVGTYNGSTIELFINGISKGTNTTTPLSVSSNILRIGRYVSVGTFFNGSIDAVQIWNRSLSASEVYQLYASNLYKYNQTQWYLYVNQSKNATNGLDYGTYNYSANVLDIAGNYNTTETRIITIAAPDTTAPTLTIITPENNSNFNVSSVLFNVSSNENVSWCGLSLDYGANVSMTIDSTLRYANLTNATMSQGYHNFTITCNDTSGNFAVSARYFVLTDVVIPVLDFTGQTPSDGVYTNSNSVAVNVSSSDNLGEHSVIVDWNRSLVGWWRFNNETGENNTFIKDYSSWSNNGSCSTNSCPNFTRAGKLGGAYVFDGVNDYVSIGSTGLPTGSFSLGLWLKFRGYTST